ncbi:MAG: FHA domain-containing protein [Thermoflexales bacterium]|nr:FHA domain-containing protein [Thermoflexales bacterium]
MDKATERYKYNCRDCPIRQQCLDDKPMSPSIKMIIARAFEQRTDTDETWAALQGDCLLLRREREQAAPQKLAVESGLLRRIRMAQQGAEQEQAATSQPPPNRAGPEVVGPEPAAQFVTAPITAAQDRTFIARPPVPAVPVVTEPCGFLVAATRRLVRLPDDDEIVVGRFEYNLGKPPDVDLNYDQREAQTVSRHHLRVVGSGGQHTIEDMGSTYGTRLNKRMLFMCEKAPLSRGDQIFLGSFQMTYLPLPKWALEPNVRVSHISYITITHIGRHVKLPDKKDVILGRPDPTLPGYIPDIDLSVAGDVAKHISRRHARLSSRGGWHFVEDMGSATGTRLNGRPIRPGDSPLLLHPGDQLWMGGCVIAYEWKVL